MLNSTGFCIIVDAYSTSKIIPSMLRKEPYFISNCIHIKSSPSLPATFQHQSSDYVISLEYNGERLENFTALIRRHTDPQPILFIIAGSESGIELADQLNNKLGLRGNDVTKSHLRRDKFKMNQAAHDAGLQTVAQCKASSIKNIFEWVKTNVLVWPIVLKPLSSQNGDHVFFCHTEKEIITAFDTITQTNNLFGQQNDTVLAQSFNDGREYIVNTVSYAGEHWISEIWRVYKHDQTTIYDYAEVVDRHATEFAALEKETYQVLNVVGTRYGAAMTEFKYTPEKGAVLLETTSRLMGNSPLAFCQKLLGYTQVSVILEALLQPKCFLRRVKSETPVEQPLYSRAVVLISNVSGILQKNIEPYFTSLKTFHSANVAKAGDKIEITTNTLSAPGEIYLMGSFEDVCADYNAIRHIEQCGFYHEAVTGNKDTTYAQNVVPVVLNRTHSPIHWVSSTTKKQESEDLRYSLSSDNRYFILDL
jgi:biotin carboxylase